MTERITAAAVRLDGAVWTLPAPARHHHILWALNSVHEERAIEVHSENQGFVTDTGRYVDRVEGKAIAAAAGQILDNGSPVLKDLYSENLW